jgi:hypothetical protein
VILESHELVVSTYCQRQNDVLPDNNLGTAEMSDKPGDLGQDEITSTNSKLL